MISSLSHELFRSVFFNFQIFHVFLLVLLLLISNWILLWLENILCKILIFWNKRNLFYGLPWGMFHVHLKKNWILPFFGMIFCKWLVRLGWLIVSFRTVTPFLLLLVRLQTTEERLAISTCDCGFVHSPFFFFFVKFCFMYVAALLLGTWTFMIFLVYAFFYHHEISFVSSNIPFSICFVWC